MIREESYTVTDKCFGRVASGYGVGAGVRCVHSRTMGGSLSQPRPPALQLVVSQSSLNVMMGQEYGTSTDSPCQLRRLFYVCSRSDKKEKNMSSYSVPAFSNRLDQASPSWTLARATPCLSRNYNHVTTVCLAPTPMVVVTQDRQR